MDKGAIMTRVIMFVLFGAVLIYMAANIAAALINPLQTVTAIEYTVEEYSRTGGYVVRDEEVLYANYAIISVTRNEGERVGVGQSYAIAYSDQTAQDRQQEIRALEIRVEQLQYSLKSTTGAVDAVKLDESIYNAMQSVKSSVQSQELSALSSYGAELKNLIFKRDYSYSGSAGIEDTIAELNAQIKALEAQATRDTITINAQQSGIFSGLVDGYETALSPKMLDTITAAQLRKIESQDTAAKNAVGKLIIDNTWYYVCALDQADAANLKEGKTVTVRFTQDYFSDLKMKIERVGAAEEDGSCIVILSTDDKLSETTQLRIQPVDIIYNVHTGIRIPKTAVRVNEEGETGVYCVVGLNAKFKKINILYETGDYYIIEKNASSTYNLWAGDEVIVAARNLFEGKVVR